MIASLRTLHVLLLAAPLAAQGSTVATATLRPGCTIPGPPESLRSAPVDPHTYLPDADGVVVIEIESASPVGSWVEEQVVGGFSGESYFRWDGPNLFTTPGVDVLSYSFQVQSAGAYALRLFSQQNHPDSSEENDCWVRVDAGPWHKLFGFQVGFWNQNAIVEGTSDLLQVNLAAGVHVLEFSGRSTNYKLDRADLVPVPTWWADVSDEQSAVMRQRPVLGASFTLEVGDPTDALGLGQQATALLALGKFPYGSPCGAVLPNYGEAMLAFPLLLGPTVLPYGGPDQPATFTITIPNDPTLLGRKFTWQGALAQPGSLTLTNGLDVTLGDV